MVRVQHSESEIKTLHSCRQFNSIPVVVGTKARDFQDSMWWDAEWMTK